MAPGEKRCRVRGREEGREGDWRQGGKETGIEVLARLGWEVGRDVGKGPKKTSK